MLELEMTMSAAVPAVATPFAGIQRDGVLSVPLKVIDGGRQEPWTAAYSVGDEVEVFDGSKWSPGVVVVRARGRHALATYLLVQERGRHDLTQVLSPDTVRRT